MKEWRGLRRILGDSGSERTNIQFEDDIFSNNHQQPIESISASCQLITIAVLLATRTRRCTLIGNPLSLASFRPWPELRWHGSRYNACRIPWGNACNGSPCPFMEKNWWGWRGWKVWTPTGLRMCQGQCSLARECWIGAILEEAPIAPRRKAY